MSVLDAPTWNRLKLECDRIEEIVNKLEMSDSTLPYRLSQEILSTYYAAGDVCVVPSYYELFGFVA